LAAVSSFAALKAEQALKQAARAWLDALEGQAAAKEIANSAEIRIASCLAVLSRFKPGSAAEATLAVAALVSFDSVVAVVIAAVVVAVTVEKVWSTQPFTSSIEGLVAAITRAATAAS
jgi:hypothetical protein